MCSDNFELDTELKNHIELIHGKTTPFDSLEENLFQCAICIDVFDQKIKLKNHIESIHGKIVPLDSL